MTHSDRTAYKTWELSLLGLLVAMVLDDRFDADEIPSRGLPMGGGAGRFGGSTSLHESVSEVLRELANPERVSQILRRACASDREVFETFVHCVNVVSRFCDQFRDEHRRRNVDVAELRRASRVLLAELDALVPARLLADDLAKHYALEDLITE